MSLAASLVEGLVAPQLAIDGNQHFLQRSEIEAAQAIAEDVVLKGRGAPQINLAVFLFFSFLRSRSNNSRLIAEICSKCSLTV